jgi:hypothetical protein
MLLGFRRAPSQAWPNLPAFTCRPNRETPAGQGRAERAGAERRTLAATAALAVGVFDSAFMSLGSSSSAMSQGNAAAARSPNVRSEPRRAFAHSLAQPGQPLEQDEIRPSRGLMSEIDWAVATRWPGP